MNESSVQQRIRLEAARMGIELYRNNSGCLNDITGRLVRFGLGNDSKALNEAIKSSDLIGLVPTKVYIESVGWVIAGIFTAIECKASDWEFNTNDKRAVAQLAFIDIVRKAGGFAGFARNVEEFKRIVGK